MLDLKHVTTKPNQVKLIQRLLLVCRERLQQAAIRKVVKRAKMSQQHKEQIHGNGLKEITQIIHMQRYGFNR